MGLIKQTILTTIAVALSSCQSTRIETYQGEPLEFDLDGLIANK